MTNGISRDTFEASDTHTKLNILFDYVKECSEHSKTLSAEINKKKKLDAGVSAITGIIGGFLAVLSTKLFGGGS